MRWVVLGPLLVLACQIELNPDFVQANGTSDATGSGTSASSTAPETSQVSTTTTEDPTTASTTDVSSSGTDGETSTTAVSTSTTGVPTTHRVFVTSTRFDGSFGGTEFADQECQARADAAGLGGTWRAILSQTGAAVRDRLAISGRVVTLDDVTVAQNADDLWDESLTGPIELDETGTPTSGKTWTGSLPDGSVDPETCDSWTMSMGFGQKGNIGSIDRRWIREGNLVCGADAGFYCLEQGG